ncbi:MAG: protein of unknown function (DUF2892) [Halorubrum sp. J07HR59]|nr:MAG: protein of unknown function (DUF2892) [Halorubrum sp. J07HR59]
MVGMDRNVGPLDAKVRVGVGAVLCLFALLQALGVATVPVLSGVGAAFAGAVLIVEGSVRRCALYSLLGINRCPVDMSDS